MGRKNEKGRDNALTGIVAAFADFYAIALYFSNMESYFTPEQHEAIERWRTHICEQVNAVVAEIVAIVTRWAKRAFAVISRFDKELRRLYLAMGAPYGDTIQGRYQWAGEEMERENRLVMERWAQHHNLTHLRGMWGHDLGAALN